MGENKKLAKMFQSMNLHINREKSNRVEKVNRTSSGKMHCRSFYSSKYKINIVAASYSRITCYFHKLRNPSRIL